MATRNCAVAALAVVVIGSLTACGGSDDQQPGSDLSPSVQTSATSIPTEAIDPSAYLPVPIGVTLAEPGTRVKFKEVVVGAWEPRQDLVAVVEVAVTRVEVTTIKASLDTYDLDDAARASTPYFVRAKVTNEGDTDLGGRQLPLYVVDSFQALLAPTGIAQNYQPCPGAALPAIFAPGDEAKTCLIFLVPEGATLASVMFRPPEGVVPITWTGKVKPLQEDEGKGQEGGDDKGRGTR